MIIKSAEFVISNTDYLKCPPSRKPEFAFIGRSNVGKSSLINMVVQRKDLAKVSGTPGKTQTINHFLINGGWHLVDLPGYGFAKVSQEARWNFGKIIEAYLQNREQLLCTFVLIDSRHDVQKIDLDFINWLGINHLPVAVLLTKTDKLKNSELAKSRNTIEQTLLNHWEELPPIFITSAVKKSGRDKILDFIQTAIDREKND